MLFKSLVGGFSAILLSAVSPLSADVIINEFMASNDQTLTDEDGDASDWIELYNNGATDVDLGGWYLTDDDTLVEKWRLPAVTLPANDYLVIFASKKQRAIAGSELHTDFSLKAKGEYLGLVMPDGVMVVQDYAPVAQFEDQSYGKTDSGFGYLATPTPGQINSGEAIPLVEFSAPSGTFESSLTLTLSSNISLKPGDVIRYTINGELPTAVSRPYSSSVTLLSTARLRARVFRQGVGGQTTFASYIKLSQEVVNVTSDLPIVVIDTFAQPVSSTDEYTPALVTFFDTVNGGASMTSAPGFAGFSGLRIRGSSSSGFPKKQYKLEIWDDTENDLDANLLGLGKEADWVLYAPGRFDRSMIANPFIYKLSGEMGRVKMDTRFVEVYLNDGTGSIRAEDYDGLYMLVESVKIDKTRVPITKMSTSDTALPEISGGYILSIDSPDDDEFSFRTTRGVPDWSSTSKASWLNVRRPKLDKLNTAQRDYITGYIQDFEDALYSPIFDDLVNGYAAYIDVPSWIDAHILRLFSMDVDILRLSNYFYKDRGGKIFNAPLWDFDRTLNSDDGSDDNPARLWNPNVGVDPVRWDWWGRLFASEHFDFRYRARWAELRNSVLSEAQLFQTIDAMQAEISNAYQRDSVRWGSTQGYGSRYGDLQGEMDALKQWISSRLTFLDSYWTINAVNLAPVSNAMADRTDFLSETVSLAIVASDPEGESLAYFADGLPAGLSMNARSGQIIGRLLEQGIYPVTVTVTDGKHDVQTGFTWTIQSVPGSIACGAPAIIPDQDRAAFLWKDCVGDGAWHFRATAGGPSNVVYQGVISSTTATLASTLLPFSFEGNDILNSTGSSTLMDFGLTMLKRGVDGFEFHHDDNATVCLAVGEPDNVELLLGASRVKATLPLDLTTLTSSAQCRQAFAGIECGAPRVDPGADKGVYAWKDCASEQWHLQFTAGGELNAIDYEGVINSSQGFFGQVDGISQEGDDRIDATTTQGELSFSQHVINRGVDGIQFTPGTNACLVINSPANAITYLGAVKKQMNTPLNLTTLGSCSAMQLGVECSPPSFDSQIDKGLFLWKSCDGSNHWHLRMTAGGDSAGVGYAGEITASQAFLSVNPVDLRGDDVLDTSDPARIAYQVSTWNNGIDGIDFIPQVGGCFENNAPVNTPVYLGSGRLPITLPFDLQTLGGC